MQAAEKLEAVPLAVKVVSQSTTSSMKSAETQQGEGEERSVSTFVMEKSTTKKKSPVTVTMPKALLPAHTEKSTSVTMQKTVAVYVENEGETGSRETNVRLTDIVNKDQSLPSKQHVLKLKAPASEVDVPVYWRATFPAVDRYWAARAIFTYVGGKCEVNMEKANRLWLTLQPQRMWL